MSQYYDRSKAPVVGKGENSVPNGDSAYKQKEPTNYSYYPASTGEYKR